MTSNLGNQSGRGRLPVQARDRRPALAALALLLIVAGGLGAGLIVYRTGRQADVLVATRTITPGHKMVASDFSTDRVSGAANRTIDASAEANFIGTTAVTTIPGGALVNRNMFHAGKIIPQDARVIGVDLSDNQHPSSGLSAGDVVSAYGVTKSNGNSQAPQVIASALYVYHVSSGNSGGTMHVDLLVTADTATVLVPAAAGNTVTLALQRAGTKPEIAPIGAS